MPLRDIEKIEFWAREYMMPLWWLTDPRHSSLGDGVFCLFKQTTLHCYYVNDRIGKDQKDGYRYFSSKGKFEWYLEHAEKMITKLKEREKLVKGVDLSRVSDKQLQTMFYNFVKLLNYFSDFYTRTEAEKMRRFESESDLNMKEVLFSVGKMRLKLRKSIEGILKILLGEISEEIVKRYGIKMKDWFFYDYQDVTNLFLGRHINQKKIDLRKKGYAFLRLHGRDELMVGTDYKRAWDLMQDMTKPTKSKELTGMAVFPGKVKGRVGLMRHDVGDLSKKIQAFREGDILVTENTTPRIIAACKKASAIVTDEGGVLCHAAIISREMKKPCIVGTKQATQILKDGDMIEVDADHGIVKIINR